MIALLYVDDERDLLEICRLFLEDYGDFTVTTVDSADMALEALKSGSFDAIVSDYQMPDKDGIAFLKEVREYFGNIPFILFTGRGREEVVIDAINNGADFYIQKGGDPRSQFTELAHKVRQATSRKKAQDELQAAYEQMAADEEKLRQQFENLAKSEMLLRESRELMRSFMDSATDAFTIYDADLNLIDINRSALEYLPPGTTREDVLGTNLKDFLSGSDEWGELGRYREVIRTGIPMSGKWKTPESRFGKHWMDIRVFRVGSGLGIVTSDVTREKEAEEELKKSEERSRRMIDEMPLPLALVRNDGIVAFLNNRFSQVFGYTIADVPTIQTWWEKAYPDPEYREKVVRQWEEDLKNSRKMREDIRTVEYIITCRNGTRRTVEVSGIALADGYLATFIDHTERSRAEAALRESERNYRTLVENSQSIIYTLTPDGTFSFVSPSWKNHLGHDPADVLGKNFRKFIHPDDIRKCEVFVEMTVTSAIPQTSRNDYRIFHADGSVHWHRSSIIPVFDENGKLVNIVGNAVDLTDRKLAEDALQESRAELASIIHGSPIPKFVIGLDHHILAWNRALEKYTGIPESEMLGTDRQWEPFYPHKRPVLADLLVDNNTDGLYKWYGGKLNPSPYVDGAYEAVDFFPTVGPKGTWLAFTASPVLNAEGTIIGAVETLEDVTSRETAAQALRTSEEMYRHILENMQDAYIRTDANGIVTMVNPAAVRMYGYASTSEMIGRPSSQLYSGGAATREKAMQKVAEAGGIYDFSGDAVRKDGSIFPVSLNVQFTRSETGQITGAEGIVRDTSERQSMEHAIREANRKLGLLNSITRHDLANQLTLLQGFTKLAAERSCDPEVSGYISRIEAAFGAIHRQIDFMKNYQELGVHSPDWFRLDAIIKKPDIPEVACTDSCTGIEIFADPMLEKVFFNLFDNALRHGTCVTEIRVECRRAPDSLTILVGDNGCGIPQGEKEKIFGKGFGKNSGFGLFLSREILAITGITIEENGVPGKGARFEIHVPEGRYRQVQS